MSRSNGTARLSSGGRAEYQLVAPPCVAGWPRRWKGACSSCIAWPGVDGTGFAGVGDLTLGLLKEHFDECHPGLTPWSKHRHALRFLAGRPINDKGDHYFGVHAPGCTERHCLCTEGMVECPDADMYSRHVQKRRLVRWECEQYEEEEYTDMPQL